MGYPKKRFPIDYKDTYQNYVSKMEQGGYDMSQPSGWTKSYNVTSILDLSWIGKLILYGAAGITILYIVIPDLGAKWKNFWCTITSENPESCDETTRTCPIGYHSKRNTF